MRILGHRSMPDPVAPLHAIHHRGNLEFLRPEEPGLCMSVGLVTGRVNWQMPGPPGIIGWIIRLIEEIRSVRAMMRVPAGARIRMLAINLEEGVQDRIGPASRQVSRLARLESLEDAPAAPAASVTISVEGGTFCLALDKYH